MSGGRLLVQRPGAAPAGHRRLLLLSANFAPSSVVGALRWSRAVALLDAHGFAFDVVCAEPAPGTGSEQALLDALPPGTRVVAVPAPPDGPWRRAMGLLASAARLRARLRPARPEAPPAAAGAAAAAPVTSATSAVRAGADGIAAVERASLPREVLRALTFLAQDEGEERWARAAVAAAAAHFPAGDYAAIVTSGPPHAVHLHADRLAQRAGVPHVVDLRDPWTHWSWVDGSKESPLFLRRTRPRQAAVMQAAQLVLTTTERQTATLRAHYPAAAARIHTVLNGADDEPLPPATDDGVFRLAYTGTLYVDRDPGPLFSAIRTFADEAELGPDRLQVEFMGHVEVLGRRRVRDIAEQAGVSPWLVLTPVRPRAEAMRLLARSHVLISFAERLKETIPAKVFEYARFPAWLLLVGPDDQATNELLAGGGALTAPADDVAAMRAALARAYAAWRAEGRPRPIAEQLPLARAAQVARMATLLREVTGGA